MMQRAWSQTVLDELAASIRSRAGLSYVPSRYDELERRTRLAMAKAGIEDVRDYTDGLGSGRFSFDDWVAELTVGETYFFRDPKQFEFVRETLVPSISALHGVGHVFRVWSAGCASGEEAYSLAMLFDELGYGKTLHLIATDVSRVALAKARRAVYNAWSLRGGSEDWIARYFRRSKNKELELDRRIRSMVTVEYLNLALDEYPSFFTGVWGNDLIMCRNVLIYLDRETIAAVARRLFDSLADGGWLLTGPSDPPLGDYAPYETVLTDAGVFYRRITRPIAITGRPRAILPNAHTARGADDEITGVRPVPARARARDAGAFRRGAEDPTKSSDPAFERATSDGGAEKAKEALDPARAAFAAGQYDRAIALARAVVDDADAAALEVRATANSVGAGEASRLCTAVLLRFPLAIELYVLQTSLLLDLREYDAAAHAARRLLYLDRSLVIAHLLLGSIVAKQGEREHAARAFRNARDLAALAPPDDVVPFSDGERAGRLADFAEAQIRLLGADLGAEDGEGQ
jgi:chemotaxis protein methyltransferase CheR